MVSLTMVPAGNKAIRLSSVNHTTKKFTFSMPAALKALKKKKKFVSKMDLLDIFLFCSKALKNY